LKARVTGGQPRGSLSPTARQLLILRVITSDDADATDAWEQLRPRLELERLELGSFDLMPLLYRRLVDVAPADPLLARLAGIYRKTWYTNQLELSRVVPALASLADAGTQPLVINGWELVLSYYGDPGVRAVAGLHVLIPPSLTVAAERALLSEGWKADGQAARRLPRRGYATPFLRDGTACVLHRELFHEFPRAVSILPRVWDTAVPFRVEGVEAGMLAPADEFLNICLSGTRARSWPNARWPADALQVVRTGDVDWHQVVDHARLSGATLRLRTALLFLRDSPSYAAPSNVFSEIEAIEVNRRERLADVLDAWRGGAAGLAPESLSRYLRATAGDRGFEAAVRLPSFLRDEWGLRRRRSVPVVAAAKAAMRLAMMAESLLRRWPPQDRRNNTP
jgi:hypothetical protein